jgi:hypothetical protein
MPAIEADGMNIGVFGFKPVKELFVGIEVVRVACPDEHDETAARREIRG